MLKKKILVVDDDPDIHYVLNTVLESRGYTVVSAQDGLEGLDKIGTEGPDLMILDLKVARVDEFNLLAKLRESRSNGFNNMPVLIVGAVREEGCRLRCELESGFELGSDNYMEKPLSPDILIEKVDRLLKRNNRH